MPARTSSALAADDDLVRWARAMWKLNHTRRKLTVPPLPQDKSPKLFPQTLLDSPPYVGFMFYASRHLAFQEIHTAETGTQ